MSVLEIFLNILAVLGSILLLFGFYRVNTGKWTNKSFWYEMDNVIGAILIIVYQIYYHAFVSVVVNIIWGGVAVIGLAAFARRAHRHLKKRRA
jgi:hypothetical protein